MSKVLHFLLGVLIFILVSAVGYWLAFEYRSIPRAPRTDAHDLDALVSGALPYIVAFLVSPVAACGVVALVSNFMDRDKSETIFIGVLVGAGIFVIFVVITIVLFIVV